MKKVTVSFFGTVIVNVEDDQHLEDVISELDITHPDNTIVCDFSIEDTKVEDSR